LNSSSNRKVEGSNTGSLDADDLDEDVLAGLEIAEVEDDDSGDIANSFATHLCNLLFSTLFEFLSVQLSLETLVWIRYLVELLESSECKAITSASSDDSSERTQKRPLDGDLLPCSPMTTGAQP
jgi:hypothetical protein